MRHRRQTVPMLGTTVNASRDETDDRKLLMMEGVYDGAGGIRGVWDDFRNWVIRAA